MNHNELRKATDKADLILGQIINRALEPCDERVTGYIGLNSEDLKLLELCKTIYIRGMINH